MSFDLVSKLLFPTPDSSYAYDSFPEELIWVPKSLDPKDAKPEDCVPCLLLPYVSARFLVFYLHSNAEDIGRCHAFCSSVRSQFQVHCLAVEYPGYGVCPGGPCDEHKATANAFTAFRFVTEVLKWPLDSIIILGRSIGCGPAISIAVRYQVAGVIVISPMLSVRELCWDVLGPVSYALEERFPNKDRVPLMSSPFLVVHGQKDSIIPCRHGVELYKACRSRKLLVCPKDMEHNTNLLADISYLVLPMLQFFSLPDYCFEEMNIPSWVYDKRMCPYYKEPRPARMSAPAAMMPTRFSGFTAKPTTMNPVEQENLSSRLVTRENTVPDVPEPSSGCFSLFPKMSFSIPSEVNAKNEDTIADLPVMPSGANRLIDSLVEPFFGHRRSEAGGGSRSVPSSPMVGSRTLGSIAAGPLFQVSGGLPRPSPPACETGDSQRAPELSTKDIEHLKNFSQASQPKVGEPSLLQRSTGAPPVMQCRPASQNRFQAALPHKGFQHPSSGASRKPVSAIGAPLGMADGTPQFRPSGGIGPNIGRASASMRITSWASDSAALGPTPKPFVCSGFEPRPGPGSGMRLDLASPQRIFEEPKAGEQASFKARTESKSRPEDLQLPDEPVPMPRHPPSRGYSEASSASRPHVSQGNFSTNAGKGAARRVVGPEDAVAPRAQAPVVMPLALDSVVPPPQPLPILQATAPGGVTSGLNGMGPVTRGTGLHREAAGDGNAHAAVVALGNNRVAPRVQQPSFQPQISVETALPADQEPDAYRGPKSEMSPSQPHRSVSTPRLSQSPAGQAERSPPMRTSQSIASALGESAHAVDAAATPAKKEEPFDYSMWL